ncbi:alpha/beta-hydrolase [Rhizoclosmatium globosum]|uniref:Alpha/beta-hydrolase n=1 Tax=Rhizoclosmatium globosum TaxID=329046 RepID=A0A1Y2CMR0_9FUNG|nr:alpha/beta-hydrolase [Rhizoclosmatium globosum]|eukprot:ORY48247.1 alpha/beta-hydrolase [Rhizoclosmatium globosum]
METTHLIFDSPHIDTLIDSIRTIVFVSFVAVSLYFVCIGQRSPNVVFHHARETVGILHNDKHFDKLKLKPTRTQLHSIVVKQCPALKKFTPTPLLFNGHLQTAAAGVISKLPYKKPDYKREVLTLPDGGLVAIDWATPLEPTPDAPIIILFHGLAGGSNEPYICETALAALEQGYRVAALNYRGSNNLSLTTPQIYAGSYTEDVRLIVRHIKSKNSTCPLIGIGYSLGANIILKYVGEEGSNCPLLTAVSVANPHDFNLGINLLHSTFLGRFYSRIMTHELINIFNKHAHMFENKDVQAPLQSEPISPTKVKSASFLHDFDEHLTRRVFGYRSVNEFYRMGGSAQYVPDVAIPMLFLNSSDDPIALNTAVPVADVLQNPHIVLAMTKCGGHIGWFESLFGFGKGYRRWFVKPVLQYVKAIVDAHESLPSTQRHLFVENPSFRPARHVHYKGKHNVVFEHQHQPKSRSSSPVKGKLEVAIDSVNSRSPVKLTISTTPTALKVESVQPELPPQHVSSTRKSAATKRSSPFLLYLLQFVSSITGGASGEGKLVQRFAILVFGLWVLSKKSWARKLIGQ